MIKRIYSLALVVCFVLDIGFTSACKKEKPITSKPPVLVTIAFDVFNHTQGPLLSFTEYVMSGAEITIKISELGVSGVDDERITIREDSFGPLVVFSRNGEATFTAPKTNKEYDIYLMNSTSSADYSKIDNWFDKISRNLAFSHNIKWHREDRGAYTGPEDPINNAISQLNNALNYSWAKYGSLNKVDSGGNFGVGYGYCSGHAGVHTSTWAGVNPELITNSNQRIRIFIDEIFEFITQTDDLNGKNTFSLITDKYGNLNEIGKDLFAYVFVKE